MKKHLANKEIGFYQPDGSYRSREEILEDLDRERDFIEFLTPLNDVERTFAEWGDIFIKRQKERREVFSIPEHVAIHIDTD